ncbi:methylmalonyl-CoA mutase family protein [Anaerobacillus sp. MEB173]|uniref:methylmalonyl-CoA mutase family protein n=1 Tax=Anaerobacillus sp. MEB173 TaxID=3383345 RepID=UPI003F93407D
MKDILAEICEFPIPSYEEWRKVTEKSLKGASFEKKLLTHTYEGITLEPMYRKENIQGIPHLDSLPGSAPYVRGTKPVFKDAKAWDVSQEICETLPEQFNEVVKHDLDRGQTSLNIVLDQATFSGYDADEAPELLGSKEGVSISSLTDLRQALADIDLTKIPVYVHSGPVSLPFFSLLIAYAKEGNVAIDQLQGTVGMDPLGALVSKGTISYDIQQSYDAMAKVTAWSKDNCPNIKTIIVEGHPYHNGGGNAVQELAFSLAAAVDYIQALVERGLNINDIAPRIQFSFSVGSNVFMEIAKLRAARLLWSTIVEAFGGTSESQKMNIHARTSSWTKTVYDPYVNMLRGTAEAFAAAVGGVDSMHVSPFDEPIQPSTSFSRRIARNTQIILQEESHLSQQVDPAGGSWYVELLTDSVAQKTWELFQEVDQNGGLLKSLEEGLPQQKIAETKAEKAKNIEHRKDIFVGTNMYPNAEEKPLATTNRNEQEVLEQRQAAIEGHRSSRTLHVADISAETVEQAISAMEQGATIGEVAKAIGRDSTSLTIKAITAERGAERFEQLRAASEAYFAETGKRLQVFLANLGPIPKHKARADFSASFFEVGGFEVLRNNGFSTAEEAANAALESKAEIIVICGTDESYQEVVPVLAGKLKESEQSITVVLAGKPAQEDQQVFKNAGVDEFIHMRSNCYEVLVKLQTEKGVVQS